MATIGSRTERLNGHIGTETRPRLLREAAVGNIAQILHNGGNSDAATPREGRRFSDCKPLSSGTIMTVPEEEATANYVPAAAVIRRWQALSGITGCKGSAGGCASWMFKLWAQPIGAFKTAYLEWCRGRRNSRCSGGMRRYREEHQWRRRPAGH